MDMVPGKQRDLNLDIWLISHIDIVIGYAKDSLSWIFTAFN